MRILRFVDKENKICFGSQDRDGNVSRLAGNLFEGFTKTNRPAILKKLLAPLQPTAILCIGLNYHQHAKETNMALPRHPVLFMKNPAALTNPFDPIILPLSCLEPPEVDYEAELAVIIGKPAKNVSAARANQYIAGYTAANDVSARRWQKHAGAGQWIRGKSFDTFCPLGPALITSDELKNPGNLKIQSIINGRVMQDANTSDMIFPVFELIEFLSQGMTLLPGTVILTGTPSGVGFIQKPPIYLKPGDKVEVIIERIGTLSNPVVAEKFRNVS